MSDQVIPQGWLPTTSWSWENDKMSISQAETESYWHSTQLYMHKKNIFKENITI